MELPLASNGKPKCPTCGCFNPSPILTPDGLVLCRQCTPEQYSAFQSPVKAPAKGKRVREPKKRRKLYTPTQWSMLTAQGNVCACCGVEGWGMLNSGEPSKRGWILKSAKGPRKLGIFCRSCAAGFQKHRISLKRFAEARRGPSGDGSRDQGGGGSQ